jgi:O-antigen ligase
VARHWRGRLNESSRPTQVQYPGGPGRTEVVDLFGLGIYCAAAAWAFTAGIVAKSDPSLTFLLLVAIGTGVLFGRLLPGIAAMIVAGSAAVLVVADPLEFMSPQPRGYPFGYSNATGAYLVQAAGACFLVARWSRSARLKLTAITAALIFGVMPLFFGTRAAGILGLLVCAVGVATVTFRRVYARRLGIVLVVIFLLALFTTVFIANDHANQGDQSLVGGVAADTLSERRGILWGDALSAMKRHPLIGVGPGNFEETSDLAEIEEDVRWVPNIFLEQAAEAGIPGLVLMVTIFLWGFGRLLWSEAPGPVLALGFTALFGIAVHSCIDYVLHYPAVPLAAGAILGSTTSDAWENHP